MDHHREEEVPVALVGMGVGSVEEGSWKLDRC
jgi:hypothetical protein